MSFKSLFHQAITDALNQMPPPPDDCLGVCAKVDMVFEDNFKQHPHKQYAIFAVLILMLKRNLDKLEP